MESDGQASFGEPLTIEGQVRHSFPSPAKLADVGEQPLQRPGPRVPGKIRGRRLPYGRRPETRIWTS